MCNYCIEKQLPTNHSRAAIGEFMKFWEKGEVINIAFMDGVSEEDKAFITVHAEEWLDHVNLHFNWNASIAESDIRISTEKGAGSWSYVGTDNRFISKSNATMNFGWISKGVVLHEFGHMLGLVHEHQSPIGGIVWNRQAVIKELSGPPYYWDEATIERNIFSKYSEDRIRGTELDPLSIMMYQILNEWTIGDFSTSFNGELSEMDIEFASTVYPFEDTEEEEEIEWEELALELAKRVFKSRRDVSRMNEDTVIRLGMEIGVPVEKKWLRRVNVDQVWNHINEE